MTELLYRSYGLSAELALDALLVSACALFEQYEPLDDDELAGVMDDTCENVYTMPL